MHYHYAKEAEVAPTGNRTRVKGLEDPHSTTELLARVALLGLEPRFPDSVEEALLLQSPMSLPLDDRAENTACGARTRDIRLKRPTLFRLS